ncbi:imidazole glycerol phosphate synthase subunit hisH [Thermanaeromonas toyohensis ToBE]|uniref:Imidazole glycerol phosphate synthase subunit HisH n=1 Tax=Thermanaeromonas toyohensis ToBE TaxID=698762 RepID=A0A1W1W2G5_9FIRM|nr:imidazole glycerol phosphate synthase subunit HisH [Thermanaeromonas toyohensis]SMB99807.1 imidazole glycerol phosphate synthase subunit hisH [Thermanaeromonas toyohensis ToBE]
MKPIAIIDYGMGNLLSVQKALDALGFPAIITNKTEEVIKAPGVILPGVGAFKDAMAALKATGLQEAIKEVCQSGKPFLGICLGLQLLFEVSEEGGWVPGLGLLPGEVRRLPAGIKVPHMGWNQVKYPRPSILFKGIPEGSFFYFVHSYHVEPRNLEVIVAETEYGGQIVAAIEQGNLFGVQFHPEKSSTLGLKLLANFGRLVYGDSFSSH